MKARTIKNEIHLSEKPTENKMGLIWITTKNEIDDVSENKCSTQIIKGQKVYALPNLPKRNITGVYLQIYGTL